MKERLKELRLFLHLSQESFGNRIGIKSRSHISALESGTRNITDRIISDICREFKVDENWLRTGEGRMFPPRDQQETLAGQLGKIIELNDPIKNEIALMLIECLNTMTEEEWASIEAHIGNIAALLEKKKEQ